MRSRRSASEEFPLWAEQLGKQIKSMTSGLHLDFAPIFTVSKAGCVTFRFQRWNLKVTMVKGDSRKESTFSFQFEDSISELKTERFSERSLSSLS